MVERLKFEKKEKVMYRIKELIIFIVGILLCTAIVRHMDGIAQKGIEGEGTEYIYVELLVWWIVAIGYIVNIVVALSVKSEKCMKRNIKKFDFSERVDELISYLGDHEEAKLRLNFYFPNACEGFEDVLLNPDNEYYVKKVGIKSLYIWAVNKKSGEKKKLCTTEDYEFFFTYFELEENIA